MLKRTTAKCFAVKFLKFKFLVCDTRWTAASRVFKQSAWIFDNPICMQTFSEFLCQHKIEATSSLFLEHLTTNQKLTYWPASVWKSKHKNLNMYTYSWFVIFGNIFYAVIATLLFARSHDVCMDDWRVLNNYSSSPNGFWVNSPWGRRPNGLLTLVFCLCI